MICYGVVFVPSVTGVNMDTNIGETAKILKLSSNILRRQNQIFKIFHLNMEDIIIKTSNHGGITTLTLKR